MLSIVCAVALVTSCVMVPKKVDYVAEECDIVRQKYVLTKTDKRYVERRKGCSGDCLEGLLGSIFEEVLLTSMSVVVSGSIALMGNSILWLEQQGDCKKYQKNNADPSE